MSQLYPAGAGRCHSCTCWQEPTGRLLGLPHVPALPCRSWQVSQLYLLAGAYTGSLLGLPHVPALPCRSWQVSQLYLLAGAYWQPPRSATCPSSTLQELAGVTAVAVGRSLLAASRVCHMSQLYPAGAGRCHSCTCWQEPTGSLLVLPHVPALPCRS
jgi:hypothetical protein